MAQWSSYDGFLRQESGATDDQLEAALADVSPGEVLQFERLGYFAADPELPGLFHRTVGLRDEWAAVQKRG